MTMFNMAFNTAFTKTITLTMTLAAALTLSACQSTPSTSPVIQRANSLYETTGLGINKIKAQQNALDSAQKTCNRKQVIVVEDKVKYNGVLNERTGRMIDKMGTVVGSVIGTTPKDMARDDDYEYMINFRCQ